MKLPEESQPSFAFLKLSPFAQSRIALPCPLPSSAIFPPPNLYHILLIAALEVSQYHSCCPSLNLSLLVQSIPHVANDRSFLKNSLRIRFFFFFFPLLIARHGRARCAQACKVA